MNKIACILILLAACQVFSAMKFEAANSILSKYMNGPTKELFKVYHYLFEKQNLYDLNTEEGVRRYRTFKDNLKFINEENSKGHTYTLGINRFSDMTNEEYREKVLINPEVFKKQVENLHQYERQFLSTNNREYTPGAIKVDWTSAFGPIRNQGSCGSCWAFATAGAIESNYNIQFKQLYSLAPQLWVDCDKTNFGCNGGWPSYAFDWASINGVALEKDYPYASGTNGIVSTCKYNSASGMSIVSGQETCGMSDCTIEKWLELLKRGPMEVCIDAGTKEFQSYTSGILQPATCGAINHAVIAYGIASDSKGDYIMVRNSWDTWWGENGNFRIRVNTANKTCGITSAGWLPIVKKFVPPNPNPTPDPDPNPTPNPDPTPDPDPTPAPVQCPVFFTECNLTGNSLESCTSIADTTGLVIDWNISSVQKINADSVSLFMGKNCGGKSIKITADEKCLAQSSDPNFKIFNKRAASLTINIGNPKDGCIWVYDDCCYGAGKEEICDSVDDLQYFKFDDRISSIRLGAGVKSVVVYQDINFAGLAFDIKSDVGCFDWDELKLLNNSISSIRFIR